MRSCRGINGSRFLSVVPRRIIVVNTRWNGSSLQINSWNSCQTHPRFARFASTESSKATTDNKVSSSTSASYDKPLSLPRGDLKAFLLDLYSGKLTSFPDIQKDLPAWQRIFGESTIKAFGLDMDRIRSGPIGGVKYNELCKVQGLHLTGTPISETAKFYYKTLELPESFNQWFQITSLHIWLLFVRMRAMPRKYGKEYQQKLVDKVFADIESRLSNEVGIRSSRAINNYMKDFNLQLRGAVLSYDEGFVKGDAVMTSALWRNLFNGRQNINYSHLEHMVHYIRTQLYVLEHVSDLDFSHGQFSFTAPYYRYSPLTEAESAEVHAFAEKVRASQPSTSEKTKLSIEGW